MLRIRGRTLQVLDFVIAYVEKNGIAPTVREIGLATNISSTSVVAYHLNKLEKAKLISRDHKYARGICATIKRDVSDEWGTRVDLPMSSPPLRKRWSKNKLGVFEYFGGCAYCSRQDVPLQTDHFVPICKGGRDSLNNIVPSCQECNTKKGSRLPAAWVIENFGVDTLENIIEYLGSCPDSYPVTQPSGVPVLAEAR